MTDSLSTKSSAASLTDKPTLLQMLTEFNRDQPANLKLVKAELAELNKKVSIKDVRI